MPRPRALYCLRPIELPRIYGPEQQAALAERLDFVAEPLSAEALRADLSVLADVELLFSGWGAPAIDAELLDAAPNLKTLFYGAGSIKNVMTDAAWDRGIQVTTAYAMNAVPVAEFTLSQIIFCLKWGYQHQQEMKRRRGKGRLAGTPGAFGSTVGLVSLGMIGRMVCERLKDLDVNVIAYDPFCSPEDAAALGVQLVTLEEVFRDSHVVSLHTPWLPETENMITGELIASMPTNASFINTSRGAVVDQPAMIQVLEQRPDLVAVLDVTHPEPPEANSPLWTLDNVVLLPHIAGSIDGETARLGQCMVDELDLYLAGKPLKWEVDRERFKTMA